MQYVVEGQFFPWCHLQDHFSLSSHSRSRRISHKKLFTICSLIVEHFLVRTNVTSCSSVNPPLFGISNQVSLIHHSREVDVIYSVRDVIYFSYIGLIGSLFACTSMILLRATTVRSPMSSLATVIAFCFELLVAIALFRTISSKLRLFVMWFMNLFNHISLGLNGIFTIPLFSLSVIFLNS